VLRTNLSTRPFYNERAAHVLIGLAALLVLALTAWNVMRIVSLSRHNTELSSTINRETIETESLTHQAAQIRKTIDKDELEGIVAAAQEANTLIDQRTFSWTRFFNRIESTLPPDVMLASVRPSFDNEGTKVTMIVLGRRTEDVDEFIEKLEATGAFEEVIPSQGDRTDQGLRREVIESRYQDIADEPAPEETAAPPATPPGRRSDVPAPKDTAPVQRGRQ
jgi:hypothetical protein